MKKMETEHKRTSIKEDYDTDCIIIIIIQIVIKEDWIQI